jgi:TonB-dependent receptor
VFIPILQDSFSESLTAKADITRKFENFSVTGGVEYTDRTLDGFTFAAVNALVLTSTVPQIGQTFTPANYVTSTPWSTNFPLGVTFNEIDNKRLRNDIEALLPALQARGLFDPSRNVPRTNFYDLGETLLAAYGQVAFEYGKADVVAGLRVERFERDSTGTVQSGTTFTPLTVTSEQTDLFPSLNVRYEVSDDVIFRVGVMRGLARPSFGQVRVGASINDTASPGTISGGNPTLEPEYTWGLDTSLEFYPNESSIFAVSAFNRWVDQVLYATTAPVGSAAFNSNNIDRSNYQLTSSFNGEDGQLFGVELNYLQQFDFLPGWASGFGFQGNVTFLDGDFDTRERAGIPFPGTSDTVVNASVFYEKYGFSGRVSYQYRSDWLDTLGGLGTGGLGDEIRKGYDNLDVTLRYALTDNLTLFADFANLTDAEYIVFQGIESRPTEVEQIGARYLAGLRFNF